MKKSRAAPPAFRAGPLSLEPEEPASSVYHVPVLAAQIATLAAGRSRAVDGTVGGGGHTALLRDAGLLILAVDRDPDALAAARSRLGDAHITWLHGRFGATETLRAIQSFHPDFILLDLGVSSAQIDRDPRGFSFRPGVPLDMRMDPGAGESGADLLNHLAESELATLFFEYGDEPKSRRLARSIVRRRGTRPFGVSDDLVNAIRETLGPRAGRPDFARLFQAIRIAVNDELADLDRALPELMESLPPAGILAVISYHSGEDRLVKHRFQGWERSCICPPRQPVCSCRGRSLGKCMPRKPIVAEPAEREQNPRARSAKLRVFRKADGG